MFSMSQKNVLEKTKTIKGTQFPKVLIGLLCFMIYRFMYINYEASYFNIYLMTFNDPKEKHAEKSSCVMILRCLKN